MTAPLLLEEQTVVCSCGVPGCRELGWPHEWDPVAAGDACLLSPAPVHRFAVYVGNGRFATTPDYHKVTAPYVRWGSGYACAECVAAYDRSYREIANA